MRSCYILLQLKLSKWDCSELRPSRTSWLKVPNRKQHFASASFASFACRRSPGALCPGQKWTASRHASDTLRVASVLGQVETFDFSDSQGASNGNATPWSRSCDNTESYAGTSVLASLRICAGKMTEMTLLPISARVKCVKSTMDFAWPGMILSFKALLREGLSAIVRTAIMWDAVHAHFGNMTTLFSPCDVANVVTRHLSEWLQLHCCLWLWPAMPLSQCGLQYRVSRSFRFWESWDVGLFGTHRTWSMTLQGCTTTCDAKACGSIRCAQSSATRTEHYREIKDDVEGCRRRHGLLASRSQGSSAPQGGSQRFEILSTLDHMRAFLKGIL